MINKILPKRLVVVLIKTTGRFKSNDKAFS